MIKIYHYYRRFTVTLLSSPPSISLTKLIDLKQGIKCAHPLKQYI